MLELSNQAQCVIGILFWAMWAIKAPSLRTEDKSCFCQYIILKAVELATSYWLASLKKLDLSNNFTAKKYYTEMASDQKLGE